MPILRKAVLSFAALISTAVLAKPVVDFSAAQNKPCWKMIEQKSSGHWFRPCWTCGSGSVESGRS